MINVLDACAASAFICILYLYAASRRKSYLPLPPGPKALPLVGNLFNVPHSLEWEKYDKMSKELDTDILHLDVAGVHLIVIGTYQAAIELLEKRSSIYSGRPRLPMVCELMGWDWNFGFLDYGHQWRTLRRIMHHSFHPAAAKKFLPHELKAARSLLRRVLKDPDNLMEHLRYLSGEAVLSTTYGFEISATDDKYINLAKAGVDPVVPALLPGTFLVDVFPCLKYVPDWFPGAGFKRKAKKWRGLALDMREIPYAGAKREIARGTHRPSLCSSALGRIDDRVDRAQQEDDIKAVAGTLFGAGADSTMGAVATCILGLINHPQVLKRAYEEIDRVLKPGNLPEFSDEPSLPYITAIVKESMRWRPTAPLALPHLTNADDEYNGYSIPKGSLIFPNAWAMLHDENIYPDPFAFNPERFMTRDGLSLDPQVRDPGFAIWGFGRRVCPGRYMAASSIWITVASLLAAFDIGKLDAIGGLDHGYGPGILRIPRPFKCSIRPRTKEMATLVQATETEEYHYEF